MNELHLDELPAEISLSYLEEMTAKSRRISSICNRIKDECEKIIKIEREASKEGYLYIEAEDDYLSFNMNTLYLADKLIAEIDERPTACGEISETKAWENYLETSVKESLNMWFKKINERYYLHLPMLPKFNYVHGNDNNWKRTKGIYFARDVRQLMNFSLEKENEMDGFLSKNVTFLFVYAASESINIPDTDAHDTKRLIDSVLSFFPGGDIGTLTSIMYKTYQTNEIPSGTYMIISKGIEKFPSKNEVFEDIKRITFENERAKKSNAE